MPSRAEGVHQLERLIGETLAELQALADREPRHELDILLSLFLVYARPLGLIAGREERLGTLISHAHSLPRPSDRPDDERAGGGR